MKQKILLTIQMNEANNYNEPPRIMNLEIELDLLNACWLIGAISELFVEAKERK